MDAKLIAERGYTTYRGGFLPSTGFIPPHWLDLEPWQQDAMICAALQMKVELLAASKSPDTGAREKAGDK